MTIEQAIILVLVGLALLVGFLAGALWQPKLHLSDLRSHTKWMKEYTRDVAKLLDDFAAAFVSKGDEP